MGGGGGGVEGWGGRGLQDSFNQADRRRAGTYWMSGCSNILELYVIIEHAESPYRYAAGVPQI